MESTRGYSAAQYLPIGQDQLVAVALWFIEQDGRRGSVENLVAEAFESFPERFALEGYPQWPNAQIVQKAWWRGRSDRKWITGSAPRGLKLTPKGQQVALETLAKLKGGNLRQMLRHGSRQTIASRVVLRIERGEPYKKFSNGERESITEFEFCEMLHCTLESPPETVSRNFDVIREEVGLYGRSDLVQLLDDLRGQFKQKFS